MSAIDLIQYVEVGSGGAASITFSSIPDTYTDLVLKFSIRGTNSAVFDQILCRINGVTTGYTLRGLYGDGSSAAVDSTSQAGMKIGLGVGATATANIFCNGTAYFPNAFGSNAKSSSADDVGENNATSAYQWIAANLSGVTDPISSLTLVSQNGTNFVQYSSATLFGITAGSDGTTTVS